MKTLSTVFFFLISTFIYPQHDIIDTELKEIVVSANKYETSLFNTANSVTVITADEIKSSQSNSVVDLLKKVPGLSVVEQGGQGKLASVFMRGANSNFVLVMIDNVEINDPSSANNAFDFSTLQVNDIDKIEIVRGPQSTLYGSEAMAGVINILTKDGNGSPSFNLKGEGGSNNFYQGHISTNGNISGLKYFGNFSRVQTDGISSIKGNNFEKDGFSENSGFIKLGYNLRQTIDFNFSYQYTRSKTDLDQSYAGGDDPNFNSVFESHLFNGITKSSFFDNKWESLLQASIYKNIITAFDRVDNLRPSTSSYSFYDGRRTSFNWQNNLKIIKNNIITLGFDSKTDQARSVYKSESESGPFKSEFPKKSITTNGTYIQDLITLNNLSATIGYRFDHNEKFGSISTFRIAPMYFIQSTSTKIKGTFGTGFKAPSLFNLFAPYYGNENLKPEQSKGWDFGFEQFLFNSKVSIGATYFSTDFTNMLGYDENFKTININKANSNGIESSLEIYNINGFTIDASYTYNNTNDISVEEFKDRQLIRRPKNYFSATIDYKANKFLNFGLSITHSGERFDNDFSSYPAQRVTLKPYTLVDIKTSYQVSEFLRIYGRIDNLFDEQYENIIYYGTLGRAVYLGFDIYLK